MNVSAWSIRQPLPAILLFVLLTAAGLMGFRAMSVQGMPDVDLPVVTVATALPGATASQMEAEVVRKLEDSLAGLGGVRHVTATVAEGQALIAVEFRLEKPLATALEDVRDVVARRRPDLPAEMREPVVGKIDLAALPVLVLTVSSPALDEQGLSTFVDETLARSLMAVRGVGSVQRVGGLTREVHVELDPARLMALNATASEISRQLRRQQQDAPAGRAAIGGEQQALRTAAARGSVESLSRQEVTLADGRRIRLDDVATVQLVSAERRSMALLDGRPVVAVEIGRTRGSGELQVADGVRRALGELQAAHPDLVVTEAFNFVEPTRQSFEHAMQLLIEGALLAVLVVALFLGDLRATLITVVALPLSTIPTFAAMQALGYTLNGVTLLSLSLVVGILVDDAIVEIENIMRHLAMGKSAWQAALDAADEIGLAVIATTATLVAVFLPTAFMSGVVGRFFVQFGWTAAIAVSFSLLVARMLTPMMAAYLLKPRAARERQPAWVEGVVLAAGWALRHRVLTVLAASGLLASVFVIVPGMATGFLPADDGSQTQVRVSLPPGATLARTAEIAEQARRIIAGVPQVRQVYTTIGGGSAGSDAFDASGLADPSRATLTLQLAPRAQRAGVRKQAIEEQIRQALASLPGVRVQVGMGSSAERYVLVLAGPDGTSLSEPARRVERELRQLAGIGHIGSTDALVRPELVVRPWPERAADLGVSTAAIADTLRVATAGDHDPALARINIADRQVPIVVRLPDAARHDLDLLGQLPVPGARGPVRLSQVAQLELSSGPAQIRREDRRRTVRFEIELNGQSLGSVDRAVRALPALASLPPGVTAAAAGDAEAMQELFSGFAVAIVAGALCIYVVLVLLMREPAQPLTILVACILALPGALLALLLARADISMPALIGVVMLLGITAKNAILIVDYILMARAQGLARHDAVLDACRKRARPVVMTTVAMIAGMLPVAIGLGGDPSFRAPMAIVVIGGLLTSTLLSLLVVPVVYSLVDDLWCALVRRPRAGRGPAAALVAPGLESRLPR